MVQIIQQNKSKEKIRDYITKHRRVFHSPLDERVDILQYSEKLARNSIQFWLMIEDQAVGFMACYFNDQINLTGFITTISLEKKYQGQGLGKRLIKEAIQYGKTHGFLSIKLQVSKTNKPAINFYLKYGFTIIEETPQSLYMAIQLQET